MYNLTGINPKQQESWNNPSHEDIRAEAALHAKLRAESFQKAAEARSKKQGDLAVFYAQQVNDYNYYVTLMSCRASNLM